MASVVSLQIYMLKSQRPASHNVSLFEDRLLTEVLRFTSDLVGGSSFSLTGVGIKRGKVETDMRPGRASCDNESRDWGDASRSHRC